MGGSDGEGVTGEMECGTKKKGQYSDKKRGHSRETSGSLGLESGTHGECLKDNEVRYSKGVWCGGREWHYFG